jgi:hypothetical protein
VTGGIIPWHANDKQANDGCTTSSVLQNILLWST